MAGKVNHLEPGDRVTLFDSAGNLHRTTVPLGDQPGHHTARHPPVEVLETNVMRPAVPFHVISLVAVAPDWHAQPRGDPAVIAMRVTEHDPIDLAERSGRFANGF